MNRRFEITRAAELPTLAVFRAFIKSICQQMNLDPGTIMDVTLAVDEACTNIIKHGYAGMNPGSIILALKFEPDKLWVDITDFGHPFEPTEPPKPDVEAIMDDQESGGFGLHIIYQTMDDIHYYPDDLGNRLVFVKQLTR
jgi:serine/threonine-protein kinase RsbW